MKKRLLPLFSSWGHANMAYIVDVLAGIGWFYLFLLLLYFSDR
ncbi:MAG TPA: hypothetical protein VFK44_06490 [Bacillales bacterium]|nr:hypothetical protein [Bacillales bacterium]